MYKLSDFEKAKELNMLGCCDPFSELAEGASIVKSFSFSHLEISFDYAKGDKILLNGYQSWTDTFEKGLDEKQRGINHIPRPVLNKYHFAQYGDYSFVEYGKKPGNLHGFSYGYIRRGKLFYFFGSLNEEKGFTLIRTSVNNQKIYFEKDLEGLTGYSAFSLPAEGYGLNIYFAVGTEKEVFDGYFNALGIPGCEARGIKPVFGYTSWYRHYQNISEAILMKDLEGLHSLETKCDVFQVDDGYQTAVGDWLSINKAKFPNGLKPVVDAATSSKLTPGIWLAPFACEKESELFKAHQDWLAKDSHGSLICGGCNWSDFYALDFYNPEVKEYIKQVITTMTKDWGFKLLKLDFLYAVCIEPREGKTRGEIMHEAMIFLKECAGDAKLLGCGIPLASAFGIVDYCRIGTDVSLSFDDVLYMRMMHRERPSTKNTLLNSIFRRQLDGRAFLNDTDVFLLRDNDIQLTVTQKRILAEVNALTGNVIFTSDDASTYSTEAKETFKKMLKLRDYHVVDAEKNGKKLTLNIAKNDGSNVGTIRIKL